MIRLILCALMVSAAAPTVFGQFPEDADEFTGYTQETKRGVALNSMKRLKRGEPVTIERAALIIQASRAARDKAWEEQGELFKNCVGWGPQGSAAVKRQVEICKWWEGYIEKAKVDPKAKGVVVPVPAELYRSDQGKLVATVELREGFGWQFIIRKASGIKKAERNR